MEVALKELPLLFCVCGDAATSEAFCLHCYVQDSTGVCSIGAGLVCTRAQCGQRSTLFCLLTFHLYLKLKLQVLPGGSSRTRGSCRRGKGRLIPMAVHLDFVIALPFPFLVVLYITSLSSCVFIPGIHTWRTDVPVV